MEFLSEDPTYLAGGLAILAGIFLVALKLTQQGKFLVWAGFSLALALLVVGVERVWVTDNERIEETVYGLALAVERSDLPGVFERLTPDVQYNFSGSTRSSADTRRLIQGILSQTKFENLMIAHLKTNAGGQARRGQAEFQVFCRGTHGSMPFAAAETAWSLGLRETSPGVWKVNRITPVSLPSHQNVLPTTFLHPDWLLEPSPAVRPSPPRFNRRSALAKLQIQTSAPPPMQP